MREFDEAKNKLVSRRAGAGRWQATPTPFMRLADLARREPRCKTLARTRTPQTNCCSCWRSAPWAARCNTISPLPWVRGHLPQPAHPHTTMGSVADPLLPPPPPFHPPSSPRSLIAHGPGETGLKRAARAMDAASCAVHALMADHLQPVLEQLAFRLGELRGLALCHSWACVSGLDAREVEAAEHAALRLVLAAEQLRVEVVRSGARHRMFCTWMLSIMRRWAGRRTLGMGAGASGHTHASPPPLPAQDPGGCPRRAGGLPSSPPGRGRRLFARWVRSRRCCALPPAGQRRRVPSARACRCSVGQQRQLGAGARGVGGEPLACRGGQLGR